MRRSKDLKRCVLRKGQAALFNLIGDVSGEARTMERAFGLHASALAEAIPLIREKPQPLNRLTSGETHHSGFRRSTDLHRAGVRAGKRLSKEQASGTSECA